MEGSAVLHRADSEETMELWDVYDIDRQKTGKLAQRVNGKSMPEGEYHLVVHICLFNAKGQLLIQQRQLDKIGYPGLWDVTAAGSALAGENSASAAARELWEEMGIRHDFHGERPFYTINFPDGFDDIYLIEKNDVALSAFTAGGSQRRKMGDPRRNRRDARQRGVCPLLPPSGSCVV